jgi:hypothetical protein
MRAAPGGRGYGVGTLLGCVPGTSRPLPPTVLVSSCPNRGERDHDRAGPIPTTARQPDVWTRTGRKPCPPAANTSRNIPPKSAGHCSPGGMGGSAQSAAARARTRGASVIVTPRGRSSRRWPAGRLATTRSTFWAAAQSGAPATAVGPVEWPAAEAGCPVPPAAVLPHAASTITALTAITASTHRTGAFGGPLRVSAVSTGLLSPTIAAFLPGRPPAEARALRPRPALPPQAQRQ